MKNEEKEAPLRGAQYPAYRVPPKAAFCLTQGLKRLALQRQMRREAEERRGVYSLSEAQALFRTVKLLGDY